MRWGGSGLRLVAALVVAALLTACSGSGDASGPTAAPSTPVSSPRPTAVVTATADPQTARLQALAQLAEQAAAKLPRGSRAPSIRLSGPLLGADISWPQCPRGLGIPERPTLGLPLPLPGASYVVLGLTNGPGFTTNPCLADQVRWVRQHHLAAAAYAVISQPDPAAVRTYGGRGPFDGTTDLGALANAGYQQALLDIATMRAADLESPVIWMDVEHVPDFEWSSDLAANGAVVQGAARGYGDAGYRVGVYSTPGLWADVVGDLALKLPEWRAAGQTSRAEALARCGAEWQIQGGSAVLAQWVSGQRDLDTTCPGAVTALSRWFVQY